MMTALRFFLPLAIIIIAEILCHSGTFVLIIYPSGTVQEVARCEGGVKA